MAFESAVILCGGQSSRMGFDKSRIKIGGRYVFEHIAEQLGHRFNEVRLIVAKGDALLMRAEPLSGIDAVDGDIWPDAGPMGGVLTGLKTAQAEYVFVTACDMPQISLPLVDLLRQKLIQAGSGCMGAVPVSGGYVEPLFGFYAKALLAPLVERVEAGALQLGKLIEAEHFVQVSESEWRALGIESPFGNLNHKSDLKLLRQVFGDALALELPETVSSGDPRVRLMEIHRCDSSGCQFEEDPVIREQLLHLYLNGKRYASVSCLPGEERAWAVGYLKGQGLIQRMEDLMSLAYEAPDLIKAILTPEAAKRGAEAMALTSGCGGGHIRLGYYGGDPLPVVQGSIAYNALDIHANMKDFSERAHLFRETGGVHSVALYRARTLIALSDDIGRHNAADKVIGQCLMAGETMSDLMMLTTGRVSSDILIKAAQAGIPLLASRSAPTDLAVSLARQAQMTLLGFVRAGRINAYAGIERLTEKAGPVGQNGL